MPQQTLGRFAVEQVAGLACDHCGEKVERRDIELVTRAGATVGEIMAKEEAA